MEALERRYFASLLFVAVYLLCGVSCQPNTSNMSYVCPPEFIRLGHSCYYFSKNTAPWHTALNDCQDRDSNLTVPARWEDRNLRGYLNNHDVEKASRWIGGIYDDASRAWKWGGELREMHYQSFSKMKKMSPSELKFHCIAMLPDRFYRWAPLLCHEQHQYICQKKLQKVTTARKKELKRRWDQMGQMNEINAPAFSHEVNGRSNDVPKSYDLQWRRQRPQKRGHNPPGKHYRPNELRKRSRPNARRLTRPFPGYTWNRRDPEASYLRNAELLRSGQTGLSAQQVKSHLARLQHLRDKQIARRKRLREREDWLVNEPKQELAQTHARTYTLDNNISALHPKTIVEEFDMFPPPQTIAVARPAHRAGYSVL